MTLSLGQRQDFGLSGVEERVDFRHFRHTGTRKRGA
jgi:hypothetical protein